MQRRGEVLALWALMVLGLALRLGGIGFGLDLEDPARTFIHNHPDERGMVETMQDGLLQGSLHPGSFLNRGPAGLLFFGLPDLLLVGALALFDPGGWTGARQALEQNPSALYLTHRLVSTLLGLWTLWLLVRLLRREFDPLSGLCAGALLAASYLHVRESHFGTVDVMWGWTVLMTVDALFRWLGSEGRGQALRAGIWAGVSAATKYFSVLLGLHLVLVHLLTRRNPARRAVSLRHLLLALGAAALAFLAVSPGLFVAWDDVRRIFDFATHNFSQEGSGSALWRNLAWHGRYSLAVGLGEPAFVLALLGLVTAWRRGPRGRFLVLVVALFLPSLLLTNMRPVRYAVPVLVLLCGTGGLALSAWLARLPRFLAVPVVLCVLAPSLLRSVSLDRLLPRTDTRVEMLAELRRRGQPAAEVLALGTHHGFPYPLQRATPPFVDYFYQAKDGRLSPDEPLRHPPRLILWDLSLLQREIPDPAARQAIEALQALTAERYTEVLRLDGRRGEVELPDPIAGSPAHYIPYSRPWTMSRPGPPLVLYERHDP